MRRAGSARPDATRAARTRPLASETAFSGKPTKFLGCRKFQNNNGVEMEGFGGTLHALKVSNTETSVKKSKKAYSYLRFSTPEQMKGDSQRRQLEAARSYALEKGLELDEELTFHDLGVS